MSTKVRQSVKVQLDSASERRKAAISNKEHEVKIRRSDMAAIARVGLFVIAIAPIGAFLSAPLLIVGLVLKEHLLPVSSPKLVEH